MAIVSSERPQDTALRRFVDLDRRLVEAAKSIKILSNLNWPARVYDEFMRGFEAGRPELPPVEHPRFDFADNVRELEAVAAASDRSHPVGEYIGRTAESYVTAARMLESVGTPAFTELSAELYGRPEGGFGVPGLTNLDAAEHFVRASDELMVSCLRTEEDFCILPQTVADTLRHEVAPFFKDRPFEVVVDPDLASRAAAGARRLRIRGSTCFHPADIPQLLQHEAYVHSATMLNGREQPNLASLGLGAPRTTATQEGLATFAELVTTSMDLSRMRRIGLRIQAIHRALGGADFIEVFRFFLEAGQSQQDSFQSARRIFRGGDMRGRTVFTRDAIYVKGLVFTHTFLRKAIQACKVDYPAWLFAGRLTWGDVISLEPFFQSGFIAPPGHQPEWAANRLSLATYLTWSLVANRINLGAVRLDDFRNLQP
jgi:uncharacterized protein (TIGR02421 family)